MAPKHVLVDPTYTKMSSKQLKSMNIKMTSISYSYDGLKLLAFCSNGRIYCWDVTQGYTLIAVGQASK